ncbi:hypothetical protein B0T25DRAFT_201787 [Lasiosphaeria hispida]|uniref:Uncharacterized protein n=1 Tax=Lasiosphaeria hispida TaxID=260671 RepID=A0AAJ0HI29_9PEZI|nr:hypothetical protein B0T25DRAFT_201787 [Lasiosphaeria hispida]
MRVMLPGGRPCVRPFLRRVYSWCCTRAVETPPSVSEFVDLLQRPSSSAFLAANSNGRKGMVGSDLIVLSCNMAQSSSAQLSPSGQHQTTPVPTQHRQTRYWSPSCWVDIMQPLHVASKFGPRHWNFVCGHLSQDRVRMYVHTWIHPSGRVRQVDVANKTEVLVLVAFSFACARAAEVMPVTKTSKRRNTVGLSIIDMDKRAARLGRLMLAEERLEHRLLRAAPAVQAAQQIVYCVRAA